ncbi:dihydrofolate reductase family protein [Spirillospora sp. CA-294931]|uniref:dihydrofolate reductase family protein n=1 Tax=Spirillospora sp. CA-294931 TaxID=3240042 RepID=UPI003D90FBA6
MRIVISQFMSLDGVVQGPGGPDEDTDGGFTNGGWTHPFFDPESVGGFLAEGMATTDAFLYGRKNWQGMAAVWPNVTDDPFAETMNSMRKYVVSSTLSQDDLTWNNSHLIPGDKAMATIRGLRETEGGDLGMMGSPTLARALFEEGLVDELRLLVMPVILGGGKTIYPSDGVLRTFEHVSSSVSPAGVSLVVYRPAAGA